MLKSGFRFSLTSLMCVLLSGCLATGGAGLGDDKADATSPADARLTTGESAEFFSKSGYEACLATGGTTALICMATGNSKSKCLVGALAVCGAAMGANYYLDSRRAQYSDSTQRLQAMTKDVQEDTKRVSMRTKTMKAVIADDKKLMTQLQKDIKAKKADTEKARKDLAQIDANLAKMRKEQEAMKNKVANYQEVLQAESSDKTAKKENLKVVEAEVQKLNSQVSALEKEIDGMYKQRSAITLG